MEVHHHAHTAPIAIGGKKWIQHFWEFLMLFLAVFCGFLAENQREHYVEHKREKQYIRSLVSDIKTDTTKTMKWLASFNRLEKNCDTILDNFSSGTKYYSRLFGRNYFQKMDLECKIKTLDEIQEQKINFWIKKDAEEFEHLYNLIRKYRETIRYYIGYVSQLKAQGSRLIDFLQNEYNLK